MDYKKIYVIELILIAMVVILFTPAAAIAQNQCDQLIVDDAGVLTNKIGDVEAAVSRLTGSGAHPSKIAVNPGSLRSAASCTT